MVTTAERLGYAPDDRVVIINCDDLGLCHSVNAGCFEAVRDGVATSMSIMIPAPWSRAASFDYRGEDVGVHLTLNAEHDRLRWGPITRAPSLLDGDGGFPRTAADVWDHADLDEVMRECRAQIERAVLWGFDVSHLDSHMGTMQLRPEFFDIYLELALEFALPLRMAGASAHKAAGFPFRDVAAAEGAVFPDSFVYVNGVGSRETFGKVVGSLRPGVTELYIHPAVQTTELCSFDADWNDRVDDLALVTTDESLRRAFDDGGVDLIGWRPLRALMMAGE